MLKPLHNPTTEGVLRVVGFMSGQGSNLQKILELEEALRKKRGRDIYKVEAIFSDTFDSRACRIGKDFDIPVISRDLGGFCARQGKPRQDLRVREEFDRQTVKALSAFEARVAVYAGYMSIVTKPLLEAYLGINVHPADLSIEVEGKRKYVGSHAVRDALLAGEPVLRSTTHIVEPVVDGGRILMISPPLKVAHQQEDIKEVVSDYQERLKQVGDWVIFPKTLQYIAEGRYAQDEQGCLFFDGQPIYQGLRLESSSSFD